MNATFPLSTGGLGHELQGQKVVSDGTYLYAYEVQDKVGPGVLAGALLFKMDLAGNVLNSWFLQLPALDTLMLTSITINPTHTHLFLSGQYKDNSQGRTEAVLLRVSTSGTGLIARTFSSQHPTGGDLMLTKVVPYVGPGGAPRLALLGQMHEYYPTTGTQIWVGELDESLTLLESYRFSSVLHPADIQWDNAHFCDVYVKNGSTLTIMGVKQNSTAVMFNWDPNSNSFLDSYGSLNNVKGLTHPTFEAPPSFQYDPATANTYLGSYVLAGSALGASVTEVAMVARLTGNFTPIWSKEYAVISGIPRSTLFIGRFAVQPAGVLFGYHVFNLNHNGSISLNPANGNVQLCLDHPDLSLHTYNLSYATRLNGQNLFFGWDDQFGSPFSRVFDTDALGIPASTNNCPPVSMPVASENVNLTSAYYWYVTVNDTTPVVAVNGSVSQESGENWLCDLQQPA
ncbi:MAG: hypothetical protein AAGB22_06155, partial [Bacteroidota bacterium]